MSHIHKKIKLHIREGASGRQTQLGPPAASSASITSEDVSATGSNHVQQEQPGDNSPSSTPAHFQQPPAAQSLWDRAYDVLAKKMPDLVREYDELLAKEEQMANSASNETSPSQLPAPHILDTCSDSSPRQVQLNTVIQNGLQRMETNKATYNIGGHEFVLADQIPEAANFLLWGKDWLGSAVKDSPEASMVWSGVCLIFPLLTDPTTAAEANRDGFAQVTSRMRYYVALEPWLRRLGKNARVDQALISAANDHLVDLYHAILKFQLSSVLHIYQSHHRTYIHNVATSLKDPVTLLDIMTLEEKKDSVRISDVATWKEYESFYNMGEDTYAIMDRALTVLDQQRQERLLGEQQECLQILYLTRNGNDATYDWYKDRVESRVEGTCMWFLQHELFQKWLLQESGPLLVSADPGCGKSVLAKYLIDHGLLQQSATICYFFFKNQDQNTNRQALCALLHQLFSQKSDLVQHAMDLYGEWDETEVQFDTLLWTILGDAVRDPLVGPVIFVIDALDECAESQLSSFMTNLKDLFGDQQQSNARFKILMTSRPSERVVSQVHRSLQDDIPRIHIPTIQAISQDINIVIHNRINQLAQTHQLSDKIKSSLNSKLLSIDRRTYPWVHLVFDYLDKVLKNTKVEIDAAIQTLPKTVNEAYDQVLNRAREEGTVETVTKALSIISAARRPLTLSEMNIAMNLTGQGRGRSIYDLDLEQDVDFKARLQALCGPFVSVYDDNIYIFHQTAREFLLQSSASRTVSSDLQCHHSVPTCHAQSVLAETCMLYLDRLNSTDTGTVRLGDHHGALFQYAVEYWGDHCREAGFGNGSAMVDLAAELCTPDLTSHSQWASIVAGRYFIHPESSTNVLIASHLGLAPVTELLLGRGADIEAKDTQGRTALMLAAKSGHEAVTRLLLENGADVKAEDDRDRTALMIVAESGHEAVARLLLNHGADVEARDYDSWTALVCAAIHGHEAVARLLLENGANVETRDGCGWTALMQAARYGHEAVVRLLLDNGAIIKASDDIGGTPLIYAAIHGHEVVVRLLLENGADVAAADYCGWSALMHAARSGDEGVTRLLLENGADVKAEDSQGRTALMLAAKSGHEAVARLLLENGADVKAEDDCGWTVLRYVAYFGHEAIAHLLLEHGADVDATDGLGVTALIIAAELGHEDVIRVLLDNGANIEAKNIKGCTALMCAAHLGNYVAARVLLNSGVDVEASYDDGCTALLYAAESGHDDILELLLEDGANIEARNCDGWTALLYAAESGYEDVVRLLLENGANVDAMNKLGRTALLCAAENGHEAVARLLLENGANVEVMFSISRRPLMLAAESGHEDVVQLLLDNDVDVEATDEHDWTALRFAANSGHEAVVQLLLDNGADVEAKDYIGSTALIHAATQGHEATTRLLLEYGSDVKTENVYGATALIAAATSGGVAVIRLLLENGSDVNARNKQGKTALILAAHNGQGDVIQLLIENGADVEAKDEHGWTAEMYGDFRSRSLYGTPYRMSRHA